MPTGAEVVATNYINGLRSKSDSERIETARSLLKFVNGELKENTTEFITDFLNGFDLPTKSEINTLASSSDPNDKKAAIFAIVCLTEVDSSAADIRVTRFSTYLQNALHSNDENVTELAAKAIAHVAVASKVYASDLVDKSLKNANEWLEQEKERNEGRRFAAVLIFRELARSTPTFFFKKAERFFENIFKIINDPKASLRVEAVTALRAALMVTSQRETKQTQKTLWYTQCFNEAIKCFDQAESLSGTAKEERLHSGLLIVNELLRIANTDAERTRQEAIDLVKSESTDENDKQNFCYPTKRSGKFIHPDGSDVISWLLMPYPSPYFESRTCRRLMNENFDKTCEYVKRARSARSSYAQHVLLELLPRLATLDPVEFMDNHLESSIQYVLNCLANREKDKGPAFLALGLFGVVAKDRIRPTVGKIFEVIRNCLPVKDVPRRKQAPVDSTVFVCLTLLVSSLGEELEGQIRGMLSAMFSTGLSSGLTVSLREVAKRIPSLRTEVQDGLLQQLSTIIMHRPMPSKLKPPTKLQLPSEPIHVPTSDVYITVLALKTLGDFHFPRHSLEMFIKYVAHGYLNSSNHVIRLATIRCCCRLLVPFVLLLDRSRDRHTSWYLPLLNMIHEIFGKLLQVAVTDPEPIVRYCVYEYLSEVENPFSIHLAQPEMLELVIMGLQDEDFDIREVVVTLLGRLGDVNPAYVMPALRRVVIQILSSLNHSGLSRVEEQSTRLLVRLVSSSPKFMKPYMQSVLQTLIPKFGGKNMHLDVVVSMLYAVGELAQVGGPELKESMVQVMPILIECLQDSSSLPKREAALWAMGRLVQHTGYVIEPYRQYPDLLDILLRFLKTEQSASMRRETIRVLGIIGALDPYQQKVFAGSVESASNSTSLALSMPDARDSRDTRQDIIQWFNWERYTLEDFYPALAIANLMHVVSDPALSDHHEMVILAVLQIFHRLGVARCLPFLDQVVPHFIPVIRDSKPELKDFCLRQLGELVAIVKQHIKPYLRDIMNLIMEYWTPKTPMRQTIISVVETVATSLEHEFKPFVPELMPSMLRVLVQDDSDDRIVTIKLLTSLKECSGVLEEQLHLLVPQAIKLLNVSDSLLSVRRVSLSMLQEFSDRLSLAQFSPSLLHSLIRVVDTSAELRIPAYTLIVSLGQQMGHNFLVFLPLIQQTIVRHKFYDPNHRLDTLVKQLQEDGRVNVDRARVRKSKPPKPDVGHRAKLPLSDTAQLERMWGVSTVASKEDWALWLSNFRKELLKQSPYAALRACARLAHHYEALSKDLFNAAFMSVWTELTEERQDKLTECLKEALDHSEHAEIIQTILNLAEFMDHSEKGPLPIPPAILGVHAMKSRAYAKALRYKELELASSTKVNADTCEALITLNNKLQLQEEAVGVVEFAKKNNVAIHLQGQWYEKLHQWEKALELYEIQNRDNSNKKFENDFSRMRCLEALGDWGRLHAISKGCWAETDPGNRAKMAGLAAAGAWGVHDWHSMETYVSAINDISQEGSFLRAVLAVHKNHFLSAQKYIDKVRDLIDTELTAMAGESYERAYGAMISVQKLSELEEAIQYKLQPERRPEITQIWRTRLKGCRDNVEDWQKLLQVRSLVLGPSDMRRTWVKFASLCRRNEKVSVSRKVLVMLLGDDPATNLQFRFPADKPDLTFAFTKQLWMEKRQQDAYDQLKSLVEGTLNHRTRHYVAVTHSPEEVDIVSLTARCYLKLGEWREILPGRTEGHPLKEETITESLAYFRAATEFDRNWYKAWHALASSNFNAVHCYKDILTQQRNSPETSASSAPSYPHQPRILPETLVSKHALHSVQCFFRAINLCRGSRLQDTLRLLTLWFEYGQQADVYDALKEGLQSVPVDTWLQVIPQLIARIDTPRHLIAKLIIDLLTEIGSVHPQALVYPLTVASNSSNRGRQQSANKLLQHMSENSPNLVQQAKLVSEELIRVAILWHEQWHEGLEEASRQYFADRNVTGMFETLEPLHNKIEAGPETLKEQSFHHTYYRDLNEALSWCRKYKDTQNARDLSQAWDLYYTVFKKISRQLPSLNQLELQYVSPKLSMCRDLELAVPGTYDPSRGVVRIRSVHTNLQVITSKQRPRKVCIKGNDGHDYWFLLKGHEDPRQDERVMQLFGLVNTLLLQEPDTCRRNLTIQRYSIIPLNPNSGLIGWVPNCDTLHALLRDYREKKKILLNIEHKLMQRVSTDYDHLTLMQKVEVFEHALEHTSGDDLQKILWLKSPSSEVWFDRRTNYTRSLATMSMVGYILGLGDRHPSNLMLDRMSGKIVHIDFGDCFEVAMTREKYPEKIPFRLTRMLVKAMEVTGIEGNFKITCERVMKVLRENRESVLAVLEAFVYDPLINWRLVDQGLVSRRAHPTDASGVFLSGADSEGPEVEQLPHHIQHSETDHLPTEAVSKKAVQVIQKIRNKLLGQDFPDGSKEADVKSQVSSLIEQAISHENLCQCYIGWCPFW